MKDHPLVPPALMLALSALFSRLFGVVRDHLLAKTFGATAGTGIYNLDVYYAAFRIPDLLYNLLIFGTVSAAFIPIFTQYKKQGDMGNAWKFASSMMHLIFLGVLAVAGVAYVFAPWLVHLVAAGFKGEALALTIRLLRIMLLSPILFSLASVLISLQDSFRCFFYRSLAPIFYNLGIIGGILYFGKEFGVVGVTWGVVIGAGLQLIIQLPAIKQIGFKYWPIFGFARPDVRKAFRLMGPRVLGLSLTQLTMVVMTLLASFLATGSITIFYLADNLQALPLGLIGISFAITSFSTLSELASEPTPDGFAHELKQVMQKILFLILPATIGMLILRREIIEVILVSGQFSAQDAQMTVQVLGWLLISLFAQSLVPTLSRGFYAYHNTKIPLVTGALGAGAAIAGSLILGLYLQMGIFGIAIAYSLGNIVNCTLLYWMMVRHLKRDILDWVAVLKMLFATMVMGIAVVLTQGFIPFGGSLLQKIGWLMVPVAVGAGVYFLLTGIVLRGFRSGGGIAP